MLGNVPRGHGREMLNGRLMRTFGADRAYFRCNASRPHWHADQAQNCRTSFRRVKVHLRDETDGWLVSRITRRTLQIVFKTRRDYRPGNRVDSNWH